MIDLVAIGSCDSPSITGLRGVTQCKDRIVGFWIASSTSVLKSRSTRATASAMRHYAAQMQADERAFLGFDAWQVYYPSLRRISGG